MRKKQWDKLKKRGCVKIYLGLGKIDYGDGGMFYSLISRHEITHCLSMKEHGIIAGNRQLKALEAFSEFWIRKNVIGKTEKQLTKVFL